MRSWAILSRAVGGALAFVLVVGLLIAAPAGSAAAAPGPVKQRPASGMTADGLPTVQINGVVWTQTTHGNTVYAGGQFTSARPAGSPAGQNETPRGNLLSFDIRTGQLNTAFAPSLNGTVKDVKVSPDGSRLYVAGSFTTANGQNRYRIAAYNTATGALISSFAPSTNATIAAIAVTDSVVYVGGWFSQANGVSRTKLAAFSASDGALLGWAPTADHDIQAMTLTPDNSKVIIGGKFKKVNGATALGIAAINAGTGALMPFQINTVVQNASETAGTYYLTRDNDTVYGTSFNFGTGNFEGVWAAVPSSGAIKWLDDCHGDTYSAFSVGGVVYSAGHPHHCQNIGGYPDTSPRNHHYLMAFTKDVTGTVATNSQTGSGYGNFAGQPAPSIVNYFPTLTAANFTGQWQAAWSLSGNSDYLVTGGEFVKVNGVAQQGLVRFAVPDKAPKKQGPVDSGSLFKPTLSTIGGGAAKITWKTNWDRDDQDLSYQVIRADRLDTPLATKSGTSQFWNRPNLTFTDTTAEPGKSYRYRIVAIDGDGNRATGDFADITMPNLPGLGTYASAVVGDGSQHYWRLNDYSLGYSPEATGGVRLRTTGVTRVASGALLNETNGAASFSGSSLSRAAIDTVAPAPARFAAEAWFKSSSSRGGKIIGYGSSQTGTSGSFDRHVYLDDEGRLTFGVGSRLAVRSPLAYNDGQWHQVVAQLGPAGLELYVDGKRVAANPAVTTAPAYNGYWRIGGDNLSTWPDRPLSDYLSGQIDEVAIFPAPLTAAQVTSHFRASGRQLANQLPTAAFDFDAAGLAVDFDGAGSSDPDGTIASYAWDFGDGETGTGVSPSHTYAAAGSYSVKLTVTDDRGGKHTATRAVAVTRVNQKPEAAFAVSQDELAIGVDASGSTDPDGTIASYAWDFGDGDSGTGKTATHTYAEAGTYTVRLTVTDNDGVVDSADRQITVAPGPATIAADAFGRTGSGWGTADTGGAWSVSGGSAFSTGGGVGKINFGAPGSLLSASLAQPSATDVTMITDLAVDKTLTGNGLAIGLLGRKVGNSDYRLKVRFLPGGETHLVLGASVNGAETIFQEINVPSVTYAPGDRLRVAFTITGNGTTTLTGKIWKVGGTEPAAAQITRTDGTAALQQAGSVGFTGYLSGNVTNAPVALSVDNLVVTTP